MQVPRLRKNEKGRGYTKMKKKNEKEGILLESGTNEIEIMKYVGAGDFIVRGPFVIEGMLIGLIGSLIPLALIYVLYGEAVGYFSSKFSILSMFLQFYSPAVIFQKLMPITLGVGVGIGILGSLSSVRRHLNV